MSELRIENWTMPAADLGAENPLPAMQPSYDSNLPQNFNDIPAEMNSNMSRGRLNHYLPYTMQDGYNRQRKPRTFKVAVLENEILRATFQLELGGRLWLLVHKPSGRELLDVNPVFQPANLAMRNAWFAGGVEWNIGAIAHSPLTCSPIFAARVKADDGMPILRLYEWERIRQVAFQIDAYLPDGSPLLFLRMRIVNPYDHEIPMYWWSNIAVPENEDTRVLVPAEAAYRFSNEREKLKVVPIPHLDGQDVSYATRATRTVDYFFEIPTGRRPWITALDGTGQGLIQVSSARLRGRKLFIWGQGTGGKNWQTFLSEPGHRYLEIQAGLARTQLEHLPMPARAEWSWLEGYGLMDADPALAHGADWQQAQTAVETQLEALSPNTDFEAEYQRGAAWVDTPPAEILHRGTGWGALEQIRRKHIGAEPFCSDGLIFDEASLTDEQTPWLELLRTGVFPQYPPYKLPKSYMVADVWHELLETSIKQNPDAGWMAWLHLGVMRWAKDDFDGARQAWEQSLQQARNPIALRNLALLAQADGDYEVAADMYLSARTLNPTLFPLLIETAKALLAAKQPQRWLDLWAQLPAEVQQNGRVRLLEAEAALAVGDFEQVQRVFDDAIVVVDLREGERSLSQLWFDYHEKRISTAENRPIDTALREQVRRDFPVPVAFDFRMNVSETG